MVLDHAPQLEADFIREAIDDHPHGSVFDQAKCGAPFEPITQLKWEGMSVLARNHDEVRVRALPESLL